MKFGDEDSLSLSLSEDAGSEGHVDTTALGLLRFSAHFVAVSAVLRVAPAHV